jgi:hypothetical protein
MVGTLAAAEAVTVISAPRMVESPLQSRSRSRRRHGANGKHALANMPSLCFRRSWAATPPAVCSARERGILGSALSRSPASRPAGGIRHPACHPSGARGISGKCRD